MDLQIGPLKTAVAAAEERARGFLARNRLDAAESTYETLLLVLHALLGASLEMRYGWQRAAHLMSDSRQRILLDALAPSRMGELQLRTAALLDLPDVLTIAAIEDIQEVIAGAITIGAARYNAGDVRGCCVVYWSTAQSLVGAPAARGFPGYARALGQLRSALETPPPVMPYDSAGMDALAWALRNVFDAILAMKS